MVIGGILGSKKEHVIHAISPSPQIKALEILRQMNVQSSLNAIFTLIKSDVISPANGAHLLYQHQTVSCNETQHFNMKSFTFTRVRSS